MKRDLRSIVLAIGFSALCMPRVALAQTYDIPVEVIGGGGGTSSSGSYELSGTAGVPAGGIGLSSASYTLDGGFWPAVQALTAVGAADTIIVDKAGNPDPPFTVYTSFKDAATALVNNGVTKPTYVLVKAGYYDNEQFTIPVITGASATNFIHFKPHPDNGAGTVVLTDEGVGTGDNWIVYLQNSKGIIFEGITFIGGRTGSGYGRLIRLEDNVEDIRILNNQFVGTTTSSSGHELIYGYNYSNNFAQNIEISGNTFNDGYRGISLTVYSSVNDRLLGLKIKNNTLTGQYDAGIFFESSIGAVIDSNTVTSSTSASTSFDGIYCEYADGSLEITRNTIRSDQGGYGINCYRNDGMNADTSGLIANNAIYLAGTVEAHGIYLSYCTYQNIYHNTVHLTNTNVSSECLILRYTTTDIKVVNNNLVNTGGGYVYDVDPNATQITPTDYNNHYTTGRNLARWGGLDRFDLAALRSASGQEANSVSYNPAFESNTDLHPRLPLMDDLGTALADVPTDLEGNTRPGPDMGAYEYTPPGAALSGSYEIGWYYYDFDTIDDALEALFIYGVSGPVSMQLIPGTYGQFRIKPVMGTSTTNTVSFESRDGVSTVEVAHSASGTGDNFVIEVNEADHIKIRNLTLKANGASFARAITLVGDANDITIEGNQLTGPNVESAYQDLALVYSGSSLADEVVITGNIFDEGSFGIAFTATTGDYATGTEVTNNTFNGQYSQSIYLSYHTAPRIIGNQLTTTSPTSTGYVGIKLYYCSNDLMVASNVLRVEGDTGLYLLYCNGNSYYNGLIANNVIDIGGSSTAQGIYVQNSSYQNFYHNTVNISNTATGSIALEQYGTSGSTNLKFQNNIFSNMTGGYVYYVYDPNAFVTLDYNLLYTTGSTLARWGSDYPADFAALQNLATSKDANSVSADPQYKDAASYDFHLQGISPAIGAGDSISVDIIGTTDIDNKPRPDPVGSNPDLGAYEAITDGPAVFITFKVDMRGYMWRGYFDPTVGDSVVVRGDFNVWQRGADLMTDTEGDSIYSRQVAVTPGTTQEYKFFNTSANDPGTGWEGDVGPGTSGNRVVTVALADTVLPAPLFDNLPLPDVWAPSKPTGFTAEAGSEQVTLSWDANPEPDVSFYTLWFNTTADPGNVDWLVDVHGGATTHTDYGLTNNTTYYYWLAAVDTAGNESDSAMVSATPSLFTETTISLPNIGHSDAMSWGDYDNDGDLDILLVGIVQGASATARIYTNQGDGTFAWASQISLITMPSGYSYSPAAAWGDYDGDGDLDIVFAYPTTEIDDYMYMPVGATDIYRNDGGSFTAISGETIGLPGVYDGSVAWGDYDNDGDLDILLTGQHLEPDNLVRLSAVYRNDGGSFTLEPLADILDPVQNGSGIWGDYDNDGDQDFLITGSGFTGPVTRIFRNDNGIFQELSLLTDLNNSAAAWGDYDNDGDLDILISGSVDGTTVLTEVYRNDGGSFTDINAGMTGLEESKVAWGDYDNDGDLDALVTGVVNYWSDRRSVLYRNDGGDVFVEEDVTLYQASFGAIAWGDYDSDGDLDLFMNGEDSGQIADTKVYRNNTATVNSPPNIPDVQTFAATPNGDGTVTFGWDAVGDDHTASNGLTYNLRVGRTPGGNEVMPAHADPGSGVLRIPAMGNVNHNTTWKLVDLAEGSYTWSVQAIDAGFQGSDFATEQTFSIEIPPATPANFTATPGDGVVELAWTANTEGDLAQYNIYRHNSDDYGNASLVTVVDKQLSTYDDYDVVNGLTYYYWVTAVDTLGFASGPASSGPVAPVGLTPNTASAWLDWERMRVRDAYPIDPANANPAAYQPTGPFTLEAWIYPTWLPGQGDTMVVISRANWTESPPARPLYDYQMHLVNPDGGGAIVEFAVVDINGNQSQVSAPISGFTWTHIAGICDAPSNDLRLLINGAVADVGQFAGPLGNTGTGFYIGLGAYIEEVPWFHGFVDEVRLWSVARTATEIEANRQQALLGTEASLSGYWPLNEATTIAGVSNVTPDITANQNHLYVWDVYFFPLYPFGPSEVWPGVAILGPDYMVVGQTRSWRVIPGGGSGTTLSLISGPGDMSFNDVDNTLTWTAAQGYEGYQTITMTASNNEGTEEADLTIWVEAVPVNRQIHANNNVAFSVYNNGFVGHQFWDEGDVGFVYQGDDGLYQGNLVIGLTGEQVSGGLGNEDFATWSTVHQVPNFLPGFDLTYRAEYDDGRSDNPIGVRVIQHSHSKSSSPDDDYVILDYTIENTSGAFQSNLRVGLAMDWDIGDYDLNLGGYDVSRALSYMYETQAVPSPALTADRGEDPAEPDAVIISTTSPTKAPARAAAQVGTYYGTALLQGPVSGHYVGNLALWDDIELDTLMSKITPDPTATDDQRSLLSAGPFDLEAGEKVRVVFAVLAGGSLADLQANVDAAQAAFSFAPKAITDLVRNVSTTQAELLGTVNPNGLSTDVIFRWGTESGNLTNSKVPGNSPASGTNDMGFVVGLDGLQPNTEYYFRIEAENDANRGEPAVGDVLSFTTPQRDDFLKTGLLAGDIGQANSLSWGDIDGDGDLDLFVANAGPAAEGGRPNFLYLNNGDGTFTRRTTGPVVEDLGHTFSGTWGDYDNDGDLDLFVTNYYDEPNILYRNDGGGFARVTSPFDGDGGRSDGAAWGDYDSDGDLDLFVANINQNNFLYANNGDGSFTKVTEGPIVADVGSSRTPAWVDYDGDSDLDLYVANSQGANDFLYQNNGPGQGYSFTKITDNLVAQDTLYNTSASWGDYDNDGDMDLYASNTAYNANVLYVNDGNGAFTIAPTSIGPIVTDNFGSGASSWGDFDNDGDLDMFVANYQNNSLYVNNGNGTFHAVSTGLLVTEQYTDDGGCAWGDYNNDGALDLAIAAWNEPNLLYRNQGSSNHWINLKLVGDISNRSGIGSKVRLKATGSPVWQTRQVLAYSGWDGQNSLNVEFGLGTATSVDSIVIGWPSGIVQVLTAVSADQFLTITEEEPGEPPLAVTLPAIYITTGSAILNAVVTPKGESTTVWFDWGENTGYGSVASVQAPIGGDQPVVVSAPITGLQANRTYHFRARAENRWGEATPGGDQVFTTPADETTTTGSQIIAGDGDVTIPGTNVTLGITFTTPGEDTIEVSQMDTQPGGSLPIDIDLTVSRYWEINHFGTGDINSVQLTLVTGPGTIVNPYLSTPALIVLLRRDQEGQNWVEIAFGTSATDSSVTFAGITGFSQFTVGEIPGSAPTSTTAAASEVGETSAKLHGTVNPGDLTTTVTFEWGTTTSYGNETPADPNEVTGTNDVQVSATLTGLTPDTEYHYRMVAENRLGRQDGTDQSFTTLLVDVQAPEIATPSIDATPPVNFGSELKVTAVVTDNVGVDQVSLHYALGGAANYKAPVTMQSSGTVTDQYEATIPGSDVGIRGIAYFVSAMDAAENTDSSDVQFAGVRFGNNTVTTNITGSAFPSGFPRDQWRFISVPADLDDRTVGSIIGNELGVSMDTTWKLFRYTHDPEDQWREASSFNRGEAYWLYQRVDSDVEFNAGAGRTNQMNTFNIELQPGWNLIGSPYPFGTPIQLDQQDFWGPITYNGNTWVTSVQNQLAPWGGYAVWNRDQTSSHIVSLTGEPGGGISKELLAKANAEPLAGWLLHLEVTGATYGDGLNTIGRLEGATEGLDYFDNPEPPYVDGFISLAMERSDWAANMPLMTSDIRSYEESDGVWDLAMYVKGERGPIKLASILQGELPPGHCIVLLDVLTREVHDLLMESEPLSIRNYREDFPYHLKVIAGSADYVAYTTEEILASLPDGFALAQNYPNPFNPLTHLRYSLYQPAKVAIKVYNLLGQEVVTLFNGWQDLGHYEVVWDGRDRSGSKVASGLYFAVYMAEGRIYTRKMVMMK